MPATPVAFSVETADDLEVAFNSALAPLLSSRIFGVALGQVRPTSNGLYGVFTYQASDTPLLTPFRAKVFSHANEAQVVMLINQFIAANPLYFFSELYITYRPQTNNPDLAVIGAIFYNVGGVSASVNWGGDIPGIYKDFFPITAARLNSERFQFFALDEMMTHHIIGRALSTWIGESVAGTGYSYAGADDRGFVLSGGTALGRICGRPGIIPAGVHITTSQPLAVTLTGYRNLAINAGSRAFVVFGVTSTITTLVGLAQKCFGIEMARGSDVGNPLGVTGEVVRLFWCDGVTTTYSGWVTAATPGMAQTSQSGFCVTITWDPTSAMLTLYNGSAQGGIRTHAAMRVNYFLSNNLAGAYVSLGLVAEDAGNVPIVSSSMSFCKISAKWNSQMILPFGPTQPDSH